MRILLDECLPVPMRVVLTGHDCIAVSDSGWKGIKNGELLRLAEGQFDLFLTADKKSAISRTLADGGFRFSNSHQTIFAELSRPLLWYSRH